MRLHSPQSAILSAVIFNALIIVALIPLALRGRALHAGQRQPDAAPQPLHLRPGRHHRAVHRHQSHRPRHPVHPRDRLTCHARHSSTACDSTSPRCGCCIVFTVIFGVAYPLGRSPRSPRCPGLQSRADGSQISVARQRRRLEAARAELHRQQGQPAAAVLPVAARPTPAPATTRRRRGASNLGPESIVDTLPDPSVKGDTGKQSLLTQVCTRSLAIGKLDGVDGARPFCTSDGVGAVLAVFWSGPGYNGTITRVVSINQAARRRRSSRPTRV